MGVWVYGGHACLHAHVHMCTHDGIIGIHQYGQPFANEISMGHQGGPKSIKMQ